VTVRQNEKTQFGAALRKCRHAHCCTAQMDCLCCKVDLLYCFCKMSAVFCTVKLYIYGIFQILLFLWHSYRPRNVCVCARARACVCVFMCVLIWFIACSITEVILQAIHNWFLTIYKVFVRFNSYFLLLFCV